MKFIQALATSQKVKVKFGTFSHHPVWRRMEEIDGFDAPDLFRPQLDLLEAQAMGQVLDQAKGRNNTGRPYVLDCGHK